MQELRRCAPALLAGGAAATTVVSIAVSQILLGLTLINLLLFARPMIRWPRAAWPLSVFLTWTLVSLAFSADPGAGFPQVKKFYVYLMLIAVFSAIRSLTEIRWIVAAWAVAGALSGIWGFGQYVHKYMTTPQFFYFVYTNERITGFMSHWMTFGGLLMMALLTTAALVLFALDRAGWKWFSAACVVIAAALLVGYTRNVWAG